MARTRTRKKAHILSNLNPIATAAIGGAAGFGAARLAVYGGRKVAAMPNTPQFVQKYNTGVILANVLGVGMAVLGKSVFIQSTGVGMVTAAIPETIRLFGVATPDQDDFTRNTMRERVNFSTEIGDEPKGMPDDMPDDMAENFTGGIKRQTREKTFTLNSTDFDLMTALNMAEEIDE